MSTLPLSLFSKLPQIAANARARSTGQLSVFAVVSQVVGCLARLFTTSTEVGDPILFVSFLLALVLNVVLAVQIWMYWGRDEVAYVPVAADEKHEGIELEGRASPSPSEKRKVEVVAPTAQQAKPGSPAPGGRRWARKVD
jgi:mannose-P-dolichol utilization defect protein 1